jgi:hypothetical protein
VFFSATSFKTRERENSTTRWDGPEYPHYSEYSTRLQSYAAWPEISEQKADNLSNAGFFYKGEALHK